MWRDASLVAQRDLRIELRTRVTATQVVPFALAVLVLFGFALDPDRGVLERAAPGLFWVVVLFSGMLAIVRSGSLDEGDGRRDGLRLSGLDPAGIFVGKAAAVAVQLLVLQVVLAGGVALLYSAPFAGYPLVVATCLAATAAVATTGTLYGALVSGLRMRHTLLPLLLLPVLAPVLIGATQAFETAFGTGAANGWAWCGFVGGIALIYLVVGSLAYGTLLETT